MSTTVFDTKNVQWLLTRLGYYDGPLDGDPHSDNYRDDLKRFQRDYGLKDDGWYGARTEQKLYPLYTVLELSKSPQLPPPEAQLRRWQLTYYYVGSVDNFTTAVNGQPAKSQTGPMVTMRLLDAHGAVSETVKMPAGAFAEAALQGSTKLLDGRLVNVTQPAYSTCSADEFKPVFDIAQRNGWVPEKAGYAGIGVSPDNKTAVRARNFALRESGPKGWPVCAKNIECDPFRTLAADNGKLGKHDPAYRDRGGVVPAGTRVFILEMVNQKLPDGTNHDGWFTVNDTGGGIYGAHFDVFTGTRALARKVKIPDRAHIWFEGIESRIGVNYSYGLA